jgi:hypothetical protein
MIRRRLPKRWKLGTTSTSEATGTWKKKTTQQHLEGGNVTHVERRRGTILLAANPVCGLDRRALYCRLSFKMSRAC